jgi:predicted enzyme related to lactoylglutathione lyase
VIEGVNKVVIEVGDQDRALDFWTTTMGFSVVEDTPYDGERWLEVCPPDRGIVLVLSVRHAEAPAPRDPLPTSNVFFYCDDLPATYRELRARGVSFPQPPVALSFGWWSMFADSEGNRFALRPRDAV